MGWSHGIDICEGVMCRGIRRKAGLTSRNNIGRCYSQARIAFRRSYCFDSSVRMFLSDMHPTLSRYLRVIISWLVSLVPAPLPPFSFQHPAVKMEKRMQGLPVLRKALPTIPPLLIIPLTTPRSHRTRSLGNILRRGGLPTQRRRTR